MSLLWRNIGGSFVAFLKKNWKYLEFFDFKESEAMLGSLVSPFYEFKKILGTSSPLFFEEKIVFQKGQRRRDYFRFKIFKTKHQRV